jgi:hypothetical protein
MSLFTRPFVVSRCRPRSLLSIVVAASLLAGVAGCAVIADEKTGSSSSASEEGSFAEHESKIATLYVYEDPTPSPTPTPVPMDGGVALDPQQPQQQRSFVSTTFDSPMMPSTMEIIDYFEVERLGGDPESVSEILAYGGTPGILYMIESGYVGPTPPSPYLGMGGTSGIRAVTEGENNGMRGWVAAGMLAFAWGGVQLEIAHLDHEIKEAREKGDFGKVNELETERKNAENHLKEISDAAKELREHVSGKDNVREGGTNADRVADFFNRLNERSSKIQGVMDKAAVKQAMEYSARAKNRGGGFNYGRDVKERRKR